MPPELRHAIPSLRALGLWPLRMLLVALAYVAAGALSLQLAIPPDYVSMVFLPAGIALGAVLVWGLGVLPGVLAGSLAVQLLASAQAGVQGWSWTIMFSPIGSVLQAALGAWLVRRLTHYPGPLDTPRSVVRLLLCAPISGLVNASISVPALVASQVIAPSEAVFSWWTWWLGDSLGTVLCLPLVLVFAGEPAALWRPRRRAVALPLLVALLLVGAGFAQIRSWEAQRLQSRLDHESSEKAGHLQRRLDAQEDSVLAVSHLMHRASQMGQPAFAEAVQPWLQRYQGTQNFGWSPRVAAAERAAYEQRQQQRIQGRLSTGHTYPAPPKSEYFPITLIEPLASNRSVLGLDVTDLKATATPVAATRTTGRAAVSEAIRLVQESGEQRGVVMYQVVYEPAQPSRVKGVVSAVFRMDDVLQAAIGEVRPHRLDACLVDTRADAANQRLSGPAGCEGADWMDATLGRRIPVQFGNGAWELRFKAGPEFLEESRNWSAWTTLALGLVSIGMLGAFLLVMTGYAHRTQALVDLRTAELAQLAHFDSLTGLPNRNAWTSRAEGALQVARRHGHALVVLFLDLDHFKDVNDTMGHAMGDQLLKTVTKRLMGCFRSEDLVARIGGDEFVALLPHVRSNDDAAVVAEKLLAALRDPMPLGSQEVSLSVSLGLSCYPDDGDTLESLLQHADTAMYAAKDAGRNCYQFFHAEMNARVARRMFIDNGLRRAIEREELFLVYQPQINTRTGAVAGVEALLRWRHPEKGLIPPDQFIPVAEDSGLIDALGTWVLHQACRQLRQWQQAGLTGLMMAVNISALQFRKPGFVRTVQQALAESGVQARHVELEITESLLMQATAELDERLLELADLGLTFALDDFGTGYSSLAYLKRLPIHRIKLDKSFVADLPGDTEDEAVVRATLSMARDLGLQCVAEGVESRAQYQFLAAHGCAYQQGYLFCRPLPAPDCLEWLQVRQSAPVSAAVPL